MNCPSCMENIAVPVKRCPHCGTRILQMEYGVVKTSIVLIATRDGQTVYPSLREVPDHLRARLAACASGRNAGTIVIADRRGKEEIESAARQQQSGQHPHQTSRLQPRQANYQAGPRWRQLWPALLALVAGAAGAWLAFLARW